MKQDHRPESIGRTRREVVRSLLGASAGGAVAGLLAGCAVEDAAMPGGSTTAAALSSLPPPEPGAPDTVYVEEFDATYKWYPSETTPSDGFRVIAGSGVPNGRWVLVGNRITLAPLGNGADDWPRLIGGACAAMAYHGEVHLKPGEWWCMSKQVTPNGTILRGGPGVHITSTLSPNPPGGAEDACPFYNSGGTELGATTTLAVAANPGELVVSVVDAGAIEVGDRLNLRNGIVRRCAREVVAKSGDQLTLDRPILRPYAAGNEVVVLPTARDIKIHGGGMRVSGTGDRCVELISAWDCLVEDVVSDGNFTYFVFGYDVGSRNSHFKRLIVDCNDFAGAAIALEYAEECTIEDGYTRRPIGQNILLTGADNCSIRGGEHSESHSAGLSLTVNHPTDPMGCRGCTIVGGAYRNGVDGAVISDGSSDNDLIGVEITDNSGIGFYLTTGWSGAAPDRNRIMGGTAKRNTVAAVFNDSLGKGNHVVGLSCEDNGQTGSVFVASNGAGAELDVADCVITDGSVVPSGRGMVLANGSSSVVRVRGVQARSTRISGYSVFCEVQGGATLHIDGGTTYSRGSGQPSIGVYVVNGTARVSGYTQTGGSDGVFLIGATANVRIADAVDLHSVVSPHTVIDGHLNRGQIALTGETPIDIVFGDTKATDRFFWSYVTATGATGGVIVEGPIVGNGFTLVADPGDESVIEYWIA